MYFPGFPFHHAREQEGEKADECVHMDLVVGPMVLRAYGEVLVVFALAKYCFDLALAAVGEKDVLGGPVVSVGDHDPLTEVGVTPVEWTG